MSFPTNNKTPKAMAAETERKNDLVEFKKQTVQAFLAGLTKTINEDELLQRLQRYAKLADAPHASLAQLAQAAIMSSKTSLGRFCFSTCADHAIESGDETMLALLLSAGLDSNGGRSTTAGCASFLHKIAATEHSQSETMCHLLLRAGADPNVASADGKTPLMLAKLDSVVIALLEAGANVDAKDDSGCTAVHHAALKNNISKLVQLEAFGADLRATCIGGFTALEHAVGYFCRDATKKHLIERAPQIGIKVMNSFAKVDAALLPQSSGVPTCISSSDSNKGHQEPSPVTLVEKNNGSSAGDGTSERIASGLMSKDMLLTFLKVQSLNTSCQLVRQALSITESMVDGDTDARERLDDLLHPAADQGQYMLLSLLLAGGANANVRSPVTGKTLLYALLGHRDSEPLINQLTNSGAKVGVVDGDLVCTIIRNDARFSLEWIIQNGLFDFTKPNDCFLQVALFFSRLDMAKILIDAGVTIAKSHRQFQHSNPAKAAEWAKICGGACTIEVIMSVDGGSTSATFSRLSQQSALSSAHEWIDKQKQSGDVNGWWMLDKSKK